VFFFFFRLADESTEFFFYIPWQSGATLLSLYGWLCIPAGEGGLASVKLPTTTTKKKKKKKKNILGRFVLPFKERVICDEYPAKGRLAPPGDL
jgi:hypothetical protein